MRRSRQFSSLIILMLKRNISHSVMNITNNKYCVCKIALVLHLFAHKMYSYIGVCTFTKLMMTFLLECDPGWRWWDDLVEGMDVEKSCLSQLSSLGSGTIIKEMGRRLSPDLFLHRMKNTHIFWLVSQQITVKILKKVDCFYTWMHCTVP